VIRPGSLADRLGPGSCRFTPIGKPGQNPENDVFVPINWAYIQVGCHVSVPDSTGRSKRMSHGSADEQWLPVLDVGPYLAGEPGALESLAAELRQACEGVGFYFLENTEAMLPKQVSRITHFDGVLYISCCTIISCR
jgi:hypothetical protein